VVLVIFTGIDIRAQLLMLARWEKYGDTVRYWHKNLAPVIACVVGGVLRVLIFESWLDRWKTLKNWLSRH